MTTRSRCTWSLPVPWDFEVVVRSHGWYDLAPFQFDEGLLETHCLISGVPATLRIRSGHRLTVDVHTEHPLSKDARADARRAVERTLHLDRPLDTLWDVSRAIPSMAWVARRGAGRLLRSPSLFEDLAKILCTTNCTWAATRGMVDRLVTVLGTETATGGRTFPTPEACADRSETWLRETLRVGYRGAALRELAQRFVQEPSVVERWETSSLDDETLRAELGALRGFGPYAVGQAMRLLGRGEDLALDSWCAMRWKELTGRSLPKPARVDALLRPYGRDRGLALWLALTAEWHGEGRPDPRSFAGQRGART